ncbi:MAG: hypothetical protein ACKVK8_05705 [Rhodospirillales bacterium]|jgi:hypothetical protein
MKFFSRFILIILLLLIVGGATFLVAWDIPSPQSLIEKVIPDERFLR